MRVLLVEDDPMLGEAVRAGLRSALHTVDWMRESRSAESALQIQDYEALVLDLGLPDRDGRLLIASLRQRGSTIPIVVISARDQLLDRVGALDIGADDYLVKPFDLEELLARLRAATRRQAAQTQALLRCGPLEVNTAKRCACVDGRVLNLTAKEYQVLVALLEGQGRVLSRERLENTLYAFGEEIGSNAVEVHIHNLRRKMGLPLIRTLRGHGYAISET